MQYFFDWRVNRKKRGARGARDVSTTAEFNACLITDVKSTEQMVRRFSSDVLENNGRRIQRKKKKLINPKCLEILESNAAE